VAATTCWSHSWSATAWCSGPPQSRPDFIGSKQISIIRPDVAGELLGFGLGAARAQVVLAYVGPDHLRVPACGSLLPEAKGLHGDNLIGGRVRS